MTNGTKTDLAAELSSISENILDLMDDFGFISVMRDEDGGIKIDTGDWHPIDGKQLNHYGTAWTDGNFLMFVGYGIPQCNRFLYYMSAEREAEISFKVDDVVIYSEVSPDRLNRWIPGRDSQDDDSKD